MIPETVSESRPHTAPPASRHPATRVIEPEERKSVTISGPVADRCFPKLESPRTEQDEATYRESRIEQTDPKYVHAPTLIFPAIRSLSANEAGPETHVFPMIENDDPKLTDSLADCIPLHLKLPETVSELDSFVLPETDMVAATRAASATLIWDPSLRNDAKDSELPSMTSLRTDAPAPEDKSAEAEIDPPIRLKLRSDKLDPTVHAPETEKAAPTAVLLSTRNSFRHLAASETIRPPSVMHDAPTDKRPSNAADAPPTEKSP